MGWVWGWGGFGGCRGFAHPLPRPRSDSSDEETPELWLGALRALRGQEQQQLRDQGRQLEESIRRVVRGRGGGRRLPPKIAARLRAQLEEKEEERGGDDDDDVGGEDSSASR